ncbi:MAG TPA: hypothetical protein VGJ33_18610 [Candidatus Angelobacter sp.]|jgi:hypothetical protein
MLGLHLSTYFGVFTHSGGVSAPLNTPTSFGFHENIVAVDPSRAWDQYITSLNSPPDVKRPSLNLPPGDFDFEMMGSDSMASRRAAVRPAGEYEYHPGN